MKMTSWGWWSCTPLFYVTLLTESCIRRREPATMPPLQTTPSSSWNETSTLDLTQLPCDQDEAFLTGCEFGTCKVIRVLNEDREIVRNPYCLCDPGYTAARCNFPVLPSTIAAPANIAVGVVIGVLLLVSIIIGVFVYNKYRRRSKMEVSRAVSVEEEVAAPFCNSPTTYCPSTKHSVPGPNQHLQSVSAQGNDENENLLGPKAPLARQETLDQVTERPVSLPNNNSHPVTIESAPLPTPNVQDFAPFGINKDGTSSRTGTAQNYAKNTYL